MFRKMRLNPLWIWDLEKTKEWINTKKHFVRFGGAATEKEDDSMVKILVMMMLKWA